MPPSITEVHAALTAPGQMFEMEEVVIRGIPTRTWKLAPPSLRAVLEQSKAHGDLTFIVYEDETLTFEQHFAAVAHLAHRLVDRLRRARRATASRSRCATSPSGRSRSGPPRPPARSSCRSTRGGPGRRAGVRAARLGIGGRLRRRRTPRAPRRALRRTARAAQRDRRAEPSTSSRVPLGDSRTFSATSTG